jgi:hypothetical protein
MNMNYFLVCLFTFNLFYILSDQVVEEAAEDNIARGASDAPVKT